MTTQEFQKKIKRVLITEQEIQDKIQEVGAQISREYEGKPLLLVSILNGAFVFMADLCRAITIPCETAFMCAKSYYNGTSSSGIVKITMDLMQDIRGYHVIIAEDIIDTGRTLNDVLKLLKSAFAESHHPAGQAGTPSGKAGRRHFPVYHSGSFCDRLWTGLWRDLSQSAVYCGV